MASPSVSIIIPTFNRRELLQQTLNSILGQTFEDWEVFVIDDRSEDGTGEFVQHLSQTEPRIRYQQRTGENPGAPICRNQGTNASSGKYIIYLDSDDCLASNALANRVQRMEQNPNLDFAIFPCILFRDQPGDTSLLWNCDSQIPDLDRFLGNDIPWQTTSPIWRRTALEKLGPWDETLPSWQDWEFHLRALMMNFNYQKFDLPDCFWRMPQQNTIGVQSKSSTHLKAREMLLLQVHQQLEANQLLTQSRLNLLRRQWFWLAETWVNQGNLPEALRVWNLGLQKQFVEQKVFNQGLFYLKTIASLPPLMQRIFKKGFKWVGDSNLLPLYSKTLRQTPFSAPLESI